MTKNRSRFIRIFVTAFALLVAAILLCGCEKFEDYENEQILVTGLGEDFYITPAELSQLECVSDTAVGQTAKAGTVQAYGPTLETFLEAYGYTLDDVRSLRTVAKDDYIVNLGRATWDKYTVILSIKNGSKALYEKQQPLRLVIPGGKSGNWTYSVIRMEFKLK